MLRSFLLLVMVLVAGCPKKGGTGPQPVAGVGCPSAKDVYIASYLAAEPGTKGHTGWVLPLHDKVVETLEGVPEYGAIDAAAAQAAGVPAPPQNLWLLLPQKGGGAAPCKVTYGSYYQAAIDAPTKNIAYGIELTGCQPPADAALEQAIALASVEPPARCAPIVPKPVAERIGEIDRDGKWSRPTKETPIPPALAAQLPQRECVAPACEALWSVGEVALNGKPVAWGVAANWLATTADASQQCEWKAETFSGLFVAGPDGAPVHVKEGQDHPLPLFAVLVDGGGAKVVIASGPGEYTAYDYVNGAVTVGRHLVWLLPDPSSYEAHLGPECP